MRGEEPRRSAFKSCRGACNAAAAFDMNEAAQAKGGIVINRKRFDFETCEEIDLRNSGVRLLSLHDAARHALLPALPSTSSPLAADMQLTPHAATVG
jgi:hypothetical protein